MLATRSSLKIALAILALFLTVPVPGPAACGSDAAAGAAADGDPCGSCVNGSTACIGAFLARLSPGDRTQRIAIPEHATRYEAPSFTFLRPPEQAA